MDSSTLIWRLLVMAGALLASFFFSASEFAVIRLDRLKVRQAAEEGSRTDRILRSFLEDTGRFLSSISIGNTLANLLLSSFAAITFAPPLARRLVRAFPGAGAAEPVAAAAVTLVLSYAVLVFGEIAPKQAAIAAGERFARRVARILRAWAWCVRPAVWCVNAGVRLALRVFGVRAPTRLAPEVTEDQILLQVEEGEHQGTVEADEKEMIENVFELNDLAAEDVMVHRKDVVALPADASWEEIRDTIRRAGVSRIPIYRGSIDTIEGVLNARDFLLRSVDSKSFAIAPLLRKPMFVPETIKADALLKRMQKRKQSLAIVIDDYGGTSGIVTVEDLVEQIVGDLYDEYDSPDDIVEIKDLGDGRWLVPGESPIDDVNEALGTELEEGEFSTLAGWIVERLASVPAQGADVDVPEHGLAMKIVRMDGHRIDAVLVRKVAPTTPAPSPGGADDPPASPQSKNSW